VLSSLSANAVASMKAACAKNTAAKASAALQQQERPDAPVLEAPAPAPAKQLSPQIAKRPRPRTKKAAAPKQAAQQHFAFDCSALEGAISAILAENAARQVELEAAAAAKRASQEAAVLAAQQAELAEEEIAAALLEEFTIQPAAGPTPGTTSRSLAFTPVEGVPERRGRSAARPAARAASRLHTPHGRTPIEGVPEKFGMFKTPATRLYRYTFTPMEGLPERCQPFQRTPAPPMQLPETSPAAAAVRGAGAAAAAQLTPLRNEAEADPQQQAQNFVDRLCKGGSSAAPGPVPSPRSASSRPPPSQLPRLEMLQRSARTRHQRTRHQRTRHQRTRHQRTRQCWAQGLQPCSCSPNPCLCRLQALWRSAHRRPCPAT
jgi:hypothetical protein